VAPVVVKAETLSKYADKNVCSGTMNLNGKQRTAGISSQNRIKNKMASDLDSRASKPVDNITSKRPKTPTLTPKADILTAAGKSRPIAVISAVMANKPVQRRNVLPNQNRIRFIAIAV
jgi:hypothetical protein